MKIRVNGELVYTETFKDWNTLEEAYTDYLTSQGKPVKKYSFESWMVAIAVFVVGQVITLVKNKVKERKEKKYKEFLEWLQQQVDRLVASKSDVDPEQLYGRALLELVKAGKVSIEPETDVERDLLRALKSLASARS